MQEYFYEDYQKIQLVLGDNGKKDESLKFITDTKVEAKNIFAGNIEDIIDLPEKRYTINPEAFLKVESYKGIAQFRSFQRYLLGKMMTKGISKQRKYF